MSDAVQELSDLLPDTSPSEVSISTGESVSIKMIGIGKIPKAIKAAMPLIAAFKEYADQMAAKEGATAFDQAEVIMHLIAEHGEAVFDFASVVLNKPREWFDDLSPDDFIAVGIAWKDRNYDFFTKRILPLLGLAVVENPTDGQTQSPSLSETATDSATSENTASDSSVSS